MTGKRGAQPVYADLAIETALSLRLLFNLALRQTKGFRGSLLRLMDVVLPFPDHTTLSRRNATVEIPYGQNIGTRHFPDACGLLHIPSTS